VSPSGEATPPGRVLVTGGSRGIGRAIALRLAAEGRRVLAVGRDARALEEVARSGGGAVEVLAADLDDGVARSRVVPHAVATLGGLDGAVLSAGIARHARLTALHERDLESTLRTNLVAPLLLARDVAAALGPGGSLVFIGSNLARKAIPGTAVYAASKAGLEAAARVLALELASRGIRVNVLSPGVVDTDMVRDRDLDLLAEAHPLGRIGTPEEVAVAAQQLLDAPWATGSVVTLDGGGSL
jgi:NAD(P)-dependent dehydrogenase (short-subunit alcohol dehydrogenase family)